MPEGKPAAWIIWFSLATVWVVSPRSNAAAQEQQQNPTGPSYTVQSMLIKNAITAVNHANLTGSYSVLRELTSERFRQQNTAADLAISFQHLRNSKLDMSSILVLQPQLTQQPVLDQSGSLHLVGLFPTRPKVVHFGLVFQSIAGGWIIDEIQLQIGPPELPAQYSRAAPAPPVAGPPRNYRTAERPAQSGLRR